MKNINMITGERVQKVLFPDSQPHIVVADIQRGDPVRVVSPIRSSLELMQLMLVSNALFTANAYKQTLVIPYLMGARYDRHMIKGDACARQVVANVVNMCGFGEVFIYDVHSKKALDLIRNSKNIDNSGLVRQYKKSDAVLIVPDKGATEKARSYQDWNPNLVDVVHCEKVRDLTDKGRVSLKVLEPERCKGRNCIIVDDICDGGATFLAIAEQIQPQHLTLMVSHGIFSKGFSKLREHFDEIITTDSFYHHSPEKVTTFTLNL